MSELQPMPAFPSHDEAMVRRIEEASLNAWPALHQRFLDGWVLRFSRGFTKRSNCIVPLYTGATDDDAVREKIRHCENLYAREQLQTVFRLRNAPGMTEDDHLDRMLASRGYSYDDESLVLSAELNSLHHAAPDDARFALLPLDQWLAVYCELTDVAEPARTLHNVILKSIAGDCGFAVLYVDENPVACGLGVVERDLVGLFDIVTHPAHRNRGMAKALVGDLMIWAGERGARRAYLQMVADNAPAAALYQHLGFTKVYRYWYRVGP